MTAYHHPRAKHARSLQASEMPAAAFAIAGQRSPRWGTRPVIAMAAELALRACDATRVSTPASCSDTKRRDMKWEVDSMAEVGAS